MQQEDGPEPVLPLPPSAPLGTEGAGGEGEVQTITVDGVGVKLDRLGPIIINTDGTMTRIANWTQMTEGERQTALRRIAKRNRERREQLRLQKEAQEQQQPKEG
jgi:hypothetical protein